MKKLQFGDAFNSALFVFKQNWLILSAVILAMLVLVYGCLFAGISLVMGDASFFSLAWGKIQMLMLAIFMARWADW